MTNLISVHDIDKPHAYLSASGSKKWLACTPSAALEAQLPDDESGYAAEGTLAHALFELRLKAYLSGDERDMQHYNGACCVVTNKHAVKDLDQVVPFDVATRLGTQEFPDMPDYVEAAAAVAIEHIEEAYRVCKDPVILLEQRLDFSPWVPEGYGTGDLVLIYSGVAKVLDLKYGKGVHVDGVDNSQMRLYGLGAYNELSHLYDIKEVCTMALQPRLGNYSGESMPVEELLQWAEEVVVPRAKLAWNGEGELVPGDHCHDGFCRARFTCPKRAEHANELAKAEFALVAPEHLTLDQQLQVLERGEAVVKWVADVKKHLLQAALNGTELPGYKLVEGRSNRKYTDQDAVAAKLVAADYPEELIFEKSLLGLTAMEKLVGKAKLGKLLDGLIEKPPGKPVLVPESDKRQALNPALAAAADFNDEQE